MDESPCPVLHVPARARRAVELDRGEEHEHCAFTFPRIKVSYTIYAGPSGPNSRTSTRLERRSRGESTEGVSSAVS